MLLPRLAFLEPDGAQIDRKERERVIIRICEPKNGISGKSRRRRRRRRRRSKRMIQRFKHVP
jgi:hypothetical protein